MGKLDLLREEFGRWVTVDGRPVWALKRSLSFLSSHAAGLKAAPFQGDMVGRMPALDTIFSFFSLLSTLLSWARLFSQDVWRPASQNVWPALEQLSPAWASVPVSPLTGAL